MTHTPETLHLEYLYGPQWHQAVRIIERSGQLTAEEREKLNAASKKLIQDKVSALSNGSGLEGGLSGLLAGLGMGANAQSVAAHPLNIATATAKAFGRSRNVQLAGMIAGQAVSPTAVGTTGDLSGLLESFGSIGAVAVVGQAVTATVLSDLIGQGEFTQAVYDELMEPWSSTIDA
ncbi:hypothetical protein [Nocardia sp. CS682]|uniref:hypothetical protein n=1 Tax=Nocardia sp. CS682 TaxID=1047172 RepID=UPI0010754D70|nr:hypothetical protein [Nocardia sp. CS682]QBS43349.1 hypothetical protein DMB37_27825 [Nocardia sp. CS682]